MSYAQDVKKELMGLDMDNCCKKATILGIFHGISEVAFANGKMRLTIKTYLPSVLRFILPYLKKEYGISPEITYQNNKNINNHHIYSLEINEKAKEIIDDFHLMPFDVITEDMLLNDCCKSSFVRGIFIAKGSVNDPKKSNYHLEINVGNIDLANLITNILKKAYINIKTINKKNRYLLYIKKSEQISETLAFMGASAGVLYFEDARIYRDLSNNVNRTMNCDIANGSKSLAYCEAQAEAIKYLEEHNLVTRLSSRLQDAIKLRKEYSDSSLSELSEFSEKVLGKSMSKSGISHCLKEIMKAYEHFKNSKNKDENKDQ